MSAVTRRLAALAIALASVTVTVTAFASPPRVVLADADPELKRAVEASLAPWHLEIVSAPDPADASLPAIPPDDAGARDRADHAHARFVLWRVGSDLVVYDRERDATERRPARAGAFDPVSAAAAALTIKTMMRLPPPSDGAVAPGPPPPAAGPELRIQAGPSVRVASGSETSIGARVALGLLVRPFPDHGWRFGAGVDLGTSATVDHAGFKGTWSDWSVLALASWTHAFPTWELEPWVGAGVTRSTLAGTEMMTPRDEAATTLALRGGLTARWRLGIWTLGATVGVETSVGTPTYTKSGSQAMIFAVPSFGVVSGLIVAADLGR